MRSASVLQVAEPAIWAELAQVFDLEAHLGEMLDPLRRVALPSFEQQVLPRLSVLVRYARRDPVEQATLRAALADQIAALPRDVRRLLHTAQRHAIDGQVLDQHAWDPIVDAPHVRLLQSAGLLTVHLQRDEGPTTYRLHPDLPDAPPIAYDFAEAVMDETDDLAPARPGPMALLHDLAALAAALHRVPTHRTHKGTLARPDARRLGRRLADADLEASGDLEAHPRWSQALRALEALGVVSMDPIARSLHLDLGLERTLAGDTVDAADRFVHRLVEADLHVVLQPIRAALRQAGAGAIDDLVFFELIAEQHRDILFPRWVRDGQAVYPGQPPHAYDDEGFERIETRLVKRVLGRAEQLGLIRTANGVFAGTDDGRRWAGAPSSPRPPVWVSSDLEVTVPPHAITPWERFQLERLGRCVQRDVVDRYRLERDGLVAWLAYHDLDEALALLARRSPAVPASVTDTLRSWAQSAERVVLTRGVLLPD